jgi:glucose-6-phosphate isomerase
MSPQDLPAWKTLTRLAATSIQTPLETLTEVEHRFDAMSCEAAGLLVDLSKQRLDSEIVGALLSLAAQRELRGRIDALFAGEHVNTTEDRPALHTALRAPEPEQPVPAAGEVTPALTRLLDFAEAVRSTAWRGASGRAITDVVHIGIGGSHLGPDLVVNALGSRGRAPRIHFVANVDGAALTAVLPGLDPETTLFVVVSKSFSTLETRVNADTARRWFLERVCDAAAIRRHFVAVTSNAEAAAEFGMPAENLFPIWDWVGGRFSLWSAVGLPIALALGQLGFQELLAGAHAMDTHFHHAPLAANAPVLLALAGIWNYDFLGVSNHAVLPYDERLALLPDYLQQLEMESNGKSVQLDGSPVGVHTMAILWGNVGTNGQHAFHQLLHQGTRGFTADFILVGRPGHRLEEHHRWLLANGLSQSQAMLRGQDTEDPHRRVPGGHATTTVVLPELTPYTLGALLALYEHKVFCQGVIWNINSFDQWGVELGKKLAVPIYEQLGGKPALGQDASTRGLIARLRALSQTS